MKDRWKNEIFTLIMYFLKLVELPEFFIDRKMNKKWIRESRRTSVSFGESREYLINWKIHQNCIEVL